MTDTMTFAQAMSSREILDARSRGETVFCEVCRTPIAVISKGDESPPLNGVAGNLLYPRSKSLRSPVQHRATTRLLEQVFGSAS